MKLANKLNGMKKTRLLGAILALGALILVPSTPIAALYARLWQSGGQRVLLAGNGGADWLAPNIAGNVLVYSDCSSGICNIWRMDTATKEATAVSPGNYEQMNPATDGTWVVWQDGRNAVEVDPTLLTNDYDIYAASLADNQEFLVTDALMLQGKPSVAGSVVVWADYRDAEIPDDPNAGDIYMFDLNTRQETRITQVPSAQSRPVTNGEVIVWVDFRNETKPDGFNGDLYGYDIATGQEFVITTEPDLQTDPAIDGDIVVWQDYRNALNSSDYNADLYGYNLSTGQEFVVTTSAGRQAHPSIAGNLVAWEDYRDDPTPEETDNPTNSDIYGYDLAAQREFPVVVAPGSQKAPSVGGNVLVYQANPDVTNIAAHWSIEGVTISSLQGATGEPLAPPATLPGEGTQDFPETGHTAAGIFLDYWNANGGLAQQGYPISEVIGEVSDLNGQAYTVQYFERAVFEYHPEEADPQYQVLLSQLGTFQYKRKYPDGAPGQQPNMEGGQLFSETGYWVGGPFLEYWNRNGGLAQQGYPISNEFTEISELDGQPYTVQYFERAVFELHPENPPPYNVLLSQLGTFQYRQKYGAP